MIGVGVGLWSPAVYGQAGTAPIPVVTDLTYDPGTNSASLVSDLPGTVFYLFNGSTSPLPGAAIEAGAAGSFAASVGANETTPDLSGLAAGSHVLHVTLKTAAGQYSEDDVFAFTLPATLTSPTDAKTGGTTASWGVTTDLGSGTLYAVASTSATAPSAAQIEAGQMHTGSAAAASASQAISSTGAKTGTFTGLTGSTTYYAHFAHKGAGGDYSNIVSGDGFTTDATSSFPSLTQVLNDERTGNVTDWESASFVLSATSRVIFQIHLRRRTETVTFDVGTPGRGIGTGTALTAYVGTNAVTADATIAGSDARIITCEATLAAGTYSVWVNAVNQSSGARIFAATTNASALGKVSVAAAANTTRSISLSTSANNSRLLHAASIDYNGTPTVSLTDTSVYAGTQGTVFWSALSTEDVATSGTTAGATATRSVTGAIALATVELLA